MAEAYHIRAATRTEVEATFARWGSPVVTPERTYAPHDVEGAVLVLPDGEIGGAVTWSVPGAEVTTLEALVAGHGYGRALLDHAEGVLRAAGLPRIRLFTTNPNIRAIALYLRRGWRVTRIHLDAMDRVRALKPGVPLEEDGLPLRDMWELVKEL